MKQSSAGTCVEQSGGGETLQPGMHSLSTRKVGAVGSCANTPTVHAVKGKDGWSEWNERERRKRMGAEKTEWGGERERESQIHCCPDTMTGPCEVDHTHVLTH